MSIFLSQNMKKYLILNEEYVNNYYINQGYFVSFSSCVIAIFKLNKEYENNNINVDEKYKILSEKVNIIKEKFNEL